VTFTGDGGSAFPGTTLDGGDVAGDFTYAYEGPTRIEGNPSTLPTVLALDPSQFGEQYNGSIPNSTITVAGGGELDLGAASAVGPVVGAGGTIVPYPGPATTPDAGAASLTLNADTKVRAVYAGPDAGTSFLAVYGNVSLGNATLTATRAASLPPQGPVVMIANLSDAGVQGTFAGLPEGAVFAASGGVLRISYVGGDGNDVTLEVPLLDGGTEGGLPSDAGEDGDIPDAAPDSMVGVTDANVPEDGRAPSDASTDATLPFEAGSPEAGPVADSAPPLEDGSLTPIEPPSGGCGCETAGAGGASPGALLGLAAIAIVGLRRRRGATSALKSPAS
jgi:MYXO-CTERM domain-containing protein